MMALKGGNAIIIAPVADRPGQRPSRAVDGMRAELEKIGLPADLVQILPQPGDARVHHALMEAADLVVVTGTQVNVRARLRSGTPAIGVGAGNVPVIIDETADLADAAHKICASKTFDNATSCSSENAVVIVDAVYDEAIAALERRGRLPGDRGRERQRIVERAVAGRQAQPRRSSPGTPQALIDGLRAVGPRPKGASSSWSRRPASASDHPFSGEKLSLVLTVYRAKDFADAKRIVRAILEHQGKGHSCGIHTTDIGARARARRATSTWCACWSTRRTPSATAAASTTASASRCRWAAAPGRGTASPRT